MAAKSKDYLRIDINDSQVRKVVCVRQGDTIARTLCISIVNAGVPIDLTNCLVAEILIKKADGYEADNGCIITGSEVQYTLRGTDIAALGENKAQIMLTFKDGEILTTPTFIISVFSQEMNPQVVASFNEYTSITQQVVMADQYATEAIESAASAKASELRTQQLAEDAIATSEGIHEAAAATLANTELAKGYMEEAQMSSEEANSAKNIILDNISRAETAKTQAELSQNAAKASEDEAKASELIAVASKETAVAAAQRAETLADEAAEEAAAGVESRLGSYVDDAQEARDDAILHEEGANTYYLQAKAIAEGFAGTLIPLGTRTFETLPAVEDAVAGWMFNISNEFTTTDDFLEGAGVDVPLGSNVYMTAEGKWDILAGSPVTGIKGNEESNYRRGNVNITPANIGAATKAEFDTHATDTNIHTTAEDKEKIAKVKVATAVSLGLVKPDNVTILIDEDGTIRGAASVGAYLTVSTSTASFNGLEITATNGAEVSKGKFNNGSATLTLRYLGDYTLSVTNTDGRVYTESVTVNALGAVLTATIDEHYTTINISTTSEELANAEIAVSANGWPSTINFVNSAAVFKAFEVGTYTFTCTYEGESYSSTVEVTELDTTLSTSIDFAATLLTGKEVNAKIKQLVGSSRTWQSSDSTITEIKFVSEAPTTQSTVNIAASGIVKAWLDGTIVKIYSPSANIYANEDCQALFYNFATVKKINVFSRIDTSNCNTMELMFYWCYALTEIDLVNMKTDNNTSFRYFFNNVSLETADLTNFNFSKATDVTCMFYSCKKLKIIYCKEDFSTNSALESQGVFYDCNSLPGYYNGANFVSNANPTTGYFTDPDNVYTVSFSSGSNIQVAKMIIAYYAGLLTLEDIKSVWSVGDTRTISLSAISDTTYVSDTHVARTYEYVILDFNHDELTEPVGDITKALLTLNMKTCMYNSNDTYLSGTSEVGIMNATATNGGGWKDSARRSWCNENFKSALPDHIKSLIRPVNKLTNKGGGLTSIGTTSDSVFLLSEIEIVNATNCSYVGEGTLYKYFETVNNRIKLPAWTSGVSYSYCWLRSPVKTNTNGFVYARSTDCSYQKANSTLGISPAFCL